MHIYHADLKTCQDFSGTVVAIDVIRAFTTSAFAFAAGATTIFPVSREEEALHLREHLTDSLIMGEVGGFPPPGFDLGNSPSALLQTDLTGTKLVQRTSAGTQGLVQSRQATQLLASSFVCAKATVDYIKAQKSTEVALVSTDASGEDLACATYLEALLKGEEPDTATLLNQAYEAGAKRIAWAKTQQNISEAQIAQFAADLACCVDLDRFSFAMVAHNQEGRLVMEQVYV